MYSTLYTLYACILHCYIARSAQCMWSAHQIENINVNHNANVPHNTYKALLPQCEITCVKKKSRLIAIISYFPLQSEIANPTPLTGHMVSVEWITYSACQYGNREDVVSRDSPLHLHTGPHNQLAVVLFIDVMQICNMGWIMILYLELKQHKGTDER